MPNGTIFTEIKQMLSEKGANIPTKQALRFTLLGLIDLYEKVDNFGTRIHNLEEGAQKLEKSSIVNWIVKHPKGFLTILLIYFTLSSLVDLRLLITDIIGKLL